MNEYQKEYNNMLIKQNGVCAICLQPETRIFKGTISALAVDHSHITGKNRDLLCYRCNSAIGYFKDSADLCRSAAKYLEEYSE